MSRVDVWMPLYIGDYLADTRRLTTTEHGAYLLLLMEQWRRGWLPDDDAQLARITGMRLDQWRKAAQTLRCYFDTGEIPGTIRQKRLHAEREKARSIAEKRAESADVRWRKSATVTAPGSEPNPLKTQDAADANAVQTDDVCMTQSQSHSKKEQGRKEVVASQPLAARPPRGSRLPLDWRPEPDEAGYAHSLGLNPDAVAENFRDFWHAKAGKDATKLDWSATWRGWCRRDAERLPSRTTRREPESKLAWVLDNANFGGRQ